MSLKVETIAVAYEKNDVLNGVSIDVAKEKITCVIGPNGSGKSTLLKSIMGFLRPRYGKISFDGQDITGLRPDLILEKGMSMVPQVRNFFPYLTVLENLQMGAYLLRDRNQIEERLEEVYNEFPILRERKRQMAATLSGGEQRMLELGRALILRPRILLLDEPSAMLAPKYLDVIFKKIQKINEGGVTILMVEQKVREALRLADQVYVLDLGQNRFEGTGKEFLGNEELVKLYLGG